MPKYRIKTNQGTFDIVADRQPSQEEALQAISENNPKPNLIAEEEIKQGLLGGTGQPMSREEAINQSRQRFVSRSKLEGQPNIQLLDGKLVDVNQLSPLGNALLSVPRAFSSGQNLGITDVAEKGIENAMISSGLTTPEVVNALGVGSQKYQQSPTDVVAGTLGSIATGAPTGSAVGQSPGLLRKLISGSSTGAQAGGLSELNNQISEGQNINPSKIGTSSLIGAAIGSSIPTAIQGLVSGTKLTKNIAGSLSRFSPEEAFDVKLGDYAADVIHPTKSAKSDLQRTVQTGQLQDDLRNIAQVGVPKGLEETLQNGRIATDSLSSKLNNHISENSDVIINNDDVGESVRNTIQGKKLVKKNVKDEINQLADQVSGDLTYREAFDLQNELNAKRQAFYKKDASGQANDLDHALNEAEQVARDMLADKLDKTYQSITGQTDNPYRQYGSLNGLLDSLSVRLDDLLTKRGIEKSVGPTLDREILATLKKNKSLLTGGEIGRIDDRINKLFSLLSENQPSKVRSLTPEEISNLPPVEREIPNSPQANQLNLEQSIKGLTQNAQNQRFSDITKKQYLKENQ